MAICSSSSFEPLENVNILLFLDGESGILRFGHPGDFGGEALDVVLLSLENLCRYEHGEVAILHSHSLDSLVEVLLHLLPNGV